MRDMPTLGKSSRRGPTRSVVIAVLVVLSLGVIYWRRRAHKSRPPTVVATAPVAVAPPRPSPTAAPERPRPSPAPSDDPLAGTGLKRLHAVVEGPLETSIVKETGAEIGRPLTQVLVRALVWWVAVPNDLRKGDVIDALYSVTGNEPDGIHLEAVRFTSEKYGKTLRAYRFQADGDRFPRLYTPDARELELRLSDAPLDDYEQVTSLLRDGRGHQGVDFKTPLGSPVKAPFDGVVARTNWNWRMNGNSVELKESGGRHRTAIFLHLSELLPETRAGAHIARGQAFAKSGNTGHSFAPHLHYQLEAEGGKLLDPFNDPQATHRPLPAEAKAAFEAGEKRLDTLLDAR